MKMKKIIASVLVAATAFGPVACGNSESGDSAKSDSSAKSTDKKEIVYGKSQGPYTELFEDAIVPILEKEGYTVKGVDLSDLQTADVALTEMLMLTLSSIQLTWKISTRVITEIW